MNFKYDSVFFDILREEKNIASFLDYVFGFLYRCTDFYVESTPEQRLGFPPGDAEQLVFNTLRNWKNVRTKKSLSKIETQSTNEKVSIGNVEIHGNNGSDFTNENSKKINIDLKKDVSSPSECYNGASCENYSWSQSIGDLDVLVRVPREVQNSKQLRVVLDTDAIEIAFGYTGASQTLIKGRLSFKIKSCESYWCLDPGKHVTLHLEKARERWWESLLEDEPRIELSKIDCSRRLEEMGECEQMKLEELMWNQRRKSLGQPTGK